jgi:hypothetical protein
MRVAFEKSFQSGYIRPTSRGIILSQSEDYLDGPYLDDILAKAVTGFTYGDGQMKNIRLVFECDVVEGD